MKKKKEDMRIMKIKNDWTASPNAPESIFVTKTYESIGSMVLKAVDMFINVLSRRL